MKKINERRFGIRSLALGVLAVGLIAAGSYAFYTKYQVDPQPPKPASAKAQVDGTKKTPAQKLSYEVPGNHPKNLIIDSLGVSANVLPMGITADGALDAPKTAWDVGWYNQSALPGSSRGALLIDGHVNDALNTPGVFYDIRMLKAGDTLKIERGDGTVYTYQVVETDQKPIEQVDMAKMLRSITPGKEGLNLITCGGVYDSSRETYNDRILVYATRVS